MGTAKVVVDRLRKQGLKVGLLRVRAFRPFPVEKILQSLSHIESVGVLDRAMSFGAFGGPLFNEVRNAFYDAKRRPLLSNYIYGLGGRDMTMEMIEQIFRDLEGNRRAGRVSDAVKYIGLRE